MTWTVVYVYSIESDRILVKSIKDPTSHHPLRWTHHVQHRCETEWACGSNSTLNKQTNWMKPWVVRGNCILRYRWWWWFHFISNTDLCKWIMACVSMDLRGQFITCELCFSDSFKVSRTCAKFFVYSCSARVIELSVHSGIGGNMWGSTRFLRKGGLSAEKSNAADMSLEVISRNAREAASLDCCQRCQSSYFTSIMHIFIVLIQIVEFGLGCRLIAQRGEVGRLGPFFRQHNEPVFQPEGCIS